MLRHEVISHRVQILNNDFVIIVFQNSEHSGSWKQIGPKKNGKANQSLCVTSQVEGHGIPLLPIYHEAEDSDEFRWDFSAMETRSKVSHSLVQVPVLYGSEVLNRLTRQQVVYWPRKEWAEMTAPRRPRFHWRSSGILHCGLADRPQSRAVNMADATVTGFPKILLFGDSLTQVRRDFFAFKLWHC